MADFSRFSFHLEIDYNCLNQRLARFSVQQLIDKGEVQLGIFLLGSFFYFNELAASVAELGC